MPSMAMPWPAYKNTATSAPWVFLPYSSSRSVILSRVRLMPSTTSKPALRSKPAIDLASTGGFGSGVTLLYVPLPTTKATRRSALAASALTRIPRTDNARINKRMAQSSLILSLAASGSRSTRVSSLSNRYPDHLFRNARRLLHRIALRSDRRVQPIATTCDDAARTNQFCTDGGISACNAASNQNERSHHEYVERKPVGDIVCRSRCRLAGRSNCTRHRIWDRRRPHCRDFGRFYRKLAVASARYPSRYGSDQCNRACDHRSDIAALDRETPSRSRRMGK